MTTRVLLGFLAGAAVLAVLAVAAFHRPAAAPTRPSPRVAAAGPSTSASASTTPDPLNPAGTPTWEGPTPPPMDPKLMKGSASAPVTIVEFGDFKCPNCRNFAQKIEPALKAKYLDTGIVKVFWRDYPIRGRDSERAAIAGRAAAQQGRFWDFYQAVYARPDLSAAGLRKAAASVGLDLARYDADLQSPAVRQAVELDSGFAAELGIPGTPAFLINGELLFGAQPVKVFEKAIEKARAEQ